MSIAMNGSHLLLIYPRGTEENTVPEVPPLGLAHLASFIRNNLEEDCKITLLDLNLHRVDKRQFRERLVKLDTKPDIIGVGGIVTVFSRFLWMSKIAKDVFPDALLIAGGSLATTVPELLFKHSPVDICVKGEGESTLLEIIKAVKSGADKKNMQHIKGLFLWDEKNNSVIASPYRPRAANIDIFGMPAYDLLDIEQYAINGIKHLKAYTGDLSPQIFSPTNLHMNITTSRGCIGRCTFCYRQFPKIGLNSAEFVKKHIMFLYNQYGINVISFMDELFNVSFDRVDEMYSCLAEVKQKIPGFYFRVIGARVDLINTKLLKKLKEIGCFQIIYGLESGSSTMLKSMKKNVTVEQNKRAVIAARDAGLHCVPQFVIGLPGENKGTLNETVKFIKSIDFWSHLAIHNANAYPGSEIYKQAKDKGLIKNEFDYVSSLAATDQYPLQLADISLREMVKIMKRYYLIRSTRLIFRKHNFVSAIFILLGRIVKKIWISLTGKLKKLVT